MPSCASFSFYYTYKAHRLQEKSLFLTSFLNVDIIVSVGRIAFGCGRSKNTLDYFREGLIAVRGVKFFLRCIKDGTVGFLGGSPPQKSGIIGMIVLFIYFLIAASIMVVYKSEKISTDNIACLFFASTVIYFAALLFVALLYDFISYILFRKKKK